jgi:hypothetical protein
MNRRIRVVSLVTSILCGACIPTVSDPPVFVEETLPLRQEWVELCELECARDNASSACDPFPGDPRTCGLFDPSAALQCYLAYRRAVAAEACRSDSRAVKTIEERCDDVYDDCPDPAEGTGGDTESSGG